MSAKVWEDFVKRADSEGIAIEGLYILEDGKPVFEHHWVFDQARNIYSHTKSFVSTGVGIAIEEGKISLEDKLVDIFPEYVPEGGNPGLEKITLRNLLTMSSGFNKALLMNTGREAGEGFPDYLAYMMSQEIAVEPGSSFYYSSGDSYLAGRMLEAKTGIPLLEYIYDRVLRPMDIPVPRWGCCPKGHPLAGGSMSMKLTDMAKLGQLYLDGGVYNGKRIVSEDWVKQASAKQIENPIPEDILKKIDKPSPWHGFGYGYQFWLSCYPGSYRADGAYGQISLVLPQKNMVVACQCPESGDFNKVRDALHESILSL